MKKKEQSPEEDKERAEDKKSGNEVGEVRHDPAASSESRTALQDNVGQRDDASHGGYFADSFQGDSR